MSRGQETQESHVEASARGHVEASACVEGCGWVPIVRVGKITTVCNSSSVVSYASDL